MPLITLTSPGAVAFHAGPISVRWYGILITAGFLAAAWAATSLARKRDIDVDHLLNGSLLGFVAGVIGARLYFVALSWPVFATHPSEIFAIWLGGLSIHGGIIGGVLAGFLYCRYAKLSFASASDIIGATLPLAQAIGRWGNFFNSEAFGKPVGSEFPLAVQIPLAQRPAGMENFAYYQATFLYESVWDLFIFFVIYFYLFDRLKKYPGINFFIYLLLYSIGRALIEPLRTDSIMMGGMPVPLVISLVLCVGAGLGVVFVWQHYKQKQIQSPKEERLNEQ